MTVTQVQRDIRIIIPAYRSDRTLEECLKAILESAYFIPNPQIVVVDCGGNHGLDVLARKYNVRILERHRVNTAARARNEGAKNFTNGVLVFIDSDVICEKSCLRKLLDPVLKGRTRATIGNYSGNLEGLGFAQKYKQLYIHEIYNRSESIIRNDFWSAIAAIDAALFQELNGFNPELIHGADQEFGIRLTRQGGTVWPVKNACGKHIYPYTVGKILRNDFRKGLTAVQNSLRSKSRFRDNRHAQWVDMAAVAFAVFSTLLLFYGFAGWQFLPAAAFAAVLWFFCRGKLITAFFQSDGQLFFWASVGLMFVLDLVRFACVAGGLVNYFFRENVPAKPAGSYSVLQPGPAGSRYKQANQPL